MKLTRFRCIGNGKIRYVNTINRDYAKAECMERYGFWPETVEEVADE